MPLAAILDCIDAISGPDDDINVTDLRRIASKDPAEAVRRGRAAAARLDPVGVAGVLIDAGAKCGDSNAIRLALALLKRAKRSTGDSTVVSYFTGNGYRVLADLAAPRRDATTGARLMSWYELTRSDRRKARLAFANAARLGVGLPGQQAWINLGNDLTASGRFIEAYTCFVNALPHPVAAGWAAEALWTSARFNPIQATTMDAQARRLAAVAQDDLDFVARCVNRSTAEYFGRMDADASPLPATDQSGWTPYERFVAKHRLHLSIAIEGVHPAEWDELRLPALNETIVTDWTTPGLVAMFNTCIADYLAARQLAFDAWRPDFSDAQLYIDSSDYAVYGQRISRLGLSLRASMDLLDRIAVAANHYFEVGLNANATDFRSLWRPKLRPRALRPAVQREVDADNFGILALIELAGDLFDDGWLAERRTLRNIATHRFLVVHDLMIGEHRKCDEITHIEEGQLKSSVLSALQIARSALSYFIGAIQRREHRLHPRGDHITVPLFLIRHDEARNL